MPKSRETLEDTLAELRALRSAPVSAQTVERLRAVLNGKSSHAAAKAAQIAGELELIDLVPDLVAAFERLMVNPVKADPSCAAKTQIAEALYRIGLDDEHVFLRGIRHVQLEPVYGGRADTAGPLRGACAFGLVRVNHRDVLSQLADLLADPEVPVRIAAAQAIAYSENENGAPLLRLKVLSGDEPTVISECLTALLKVAPQSGLSFVSCLLDAPDETLRETAALALGGSRLHDAFGELRQWFERTASPEWRRLALLTIAMLKHDGPIDYLLSLVATAEGPTARDAIAALALYKHDDALHGRVAKAAERDDVDLHAAVVESFEGKARRGGRR